MKILRSSGAGLKSEEKRKLSMATPLIVLGVGLAAGAAILAFIKPFLNRREPPKN